FVVFSYMAYVFLLLFPFFSLSFFFSFLTGPHPLLHSFPTRRSSDLLHGRPHHPLGRRERLGDRARPDRSRRQRPGGHRALHRVGDRKSTRLNSSHVSISYAVFCLKKKIKII